MNTIANDVLKWIPAHDTTSEDEPMYLRSDVIKAMDDYYNKKVAMRNDKPIPLDYWIFYAEKLPSKAGFYETKDSGDDRNILYHGGDGLPTPWYKDAGCSEKYKGFISYWRPVQKSLN